MTLNHLIIRYQNALAQKNDVEAERLAARIEKVREMGIRHKAEREAA